MSGSWNYLQSVRGQSLGCGCPSSRNLGGFGGTAAADAAAAQEQLRSQTAGLQDRYGDALSKYGDAVRQGIQTAEMMADSGASTEEILNGIAGGIASAGAIIAASFPVAGWIVGAAAEVAAAILAAANWLVSSYPAMPRDPAQAGVNHALKVLGYSTSSESIFRLDTQALMKAASEGWFFYTRQRTTGESYATMTKRFPLDVQATLCSKYSDGSNYGRSRYSCDTELNRGGTLSSPGCVELSNIPVLGRERFMHIFSRIGSSGVNYPLTLQGTASGSNPYRSAGSLLWHWEDEGVQSVVAAWKLSALPEDMQRAIKSALLAPRDEWPNDRGVGFCLSQTQVSDTASDLERKSAAQRLAYVAKSFPASSIRTGIRGEDRRVVSEGGGVGTAVAVVGGVSVLALLAWLALK